LKPSIHPLAARRLGAHLLDWVDEPLVVGWTVYWIHPLHNPVRTLLATGWCLWVATQLVAQATTGQTFGKRVTGIRVVDSRTDQPLGLRRTLSRWLTHTVDTLTIAGWIATLATNASAADRLLHTKVTSITRRGRRSPQSG